MVAFNWFGMAGNQSGRDGGSKEATAPIGQTVEIDKAEQNGLDEMLKNVEKKGMPELARRIELVLEEIKTEMDTEVANLLTSDKAYVVDYTIQLLKELIKRVGEKNLSFSDKELALIVNNKNLLAKSGLLPNYPAQETILSNPGKIGDDINYCLKILGVDVSEYSADELTELMNTIKASKSPDKELVGAAR